MQDVEVEGNYAYCAMRYYGLLIYDVSDPSSPVEVGHLYLPGEEFHGHYDITVQGSYAYSARYNDGVQIIDVSDPTQPFLVWSSGRMYIHSVMVSGDKAFFAGSGVKVYDITDPTAPVFLTQLNPPGQTHALFTYSTALYDDYLLMSHAGLGGDSGWVSVVDISDLGAAEVVGAYASHGDNIVVDGSKAYLADGSLRILDVSNPEVLTELGRLIVSGSISRVRVQGDYAYLTAGGKRVLIADISIPSSPTVISELPSPELVMGLDVSGKCVYWAEYSSGLGIGDISDPSVPIPVTGQAPSSRPVRVALSSGHAYTFGHTDKIDVLDVADPSQPRKVGEAGRLEYPQEIAIADDLLFLLDAWALEIYELVTPTQLDSIGKFELPWIEGELSSIVVRGSTVYAASGRLGYAPAGLEVIDVHDPTKPVRIGRYTNWIDDGGISVAQSGDYAYVGSSHFVSIIDVSDPANPVGVKRFSPPARPWSMVADGEYLYIAANVPGWWKGMFVVFDVSDPTSPVELARDTTASVPYDIKISDDFAFISSDAAGVEVFSIRDPSDPTLVCRYNTPAFAREVEIVGDYVYVADTYAFDVLQFSPPVAVEGDDAVVPRETRLSQNYPNPFNAGTRIRFTLTHPAEVEVILHNVLGKRIATITKGYFPADEHEVSWDGRLSSGADAPSGVYFYRLRTNSYSETRKLLLLR